MPRLSILSLLLFTAYFAVCALVYTSRNPGIGWLVVAATAVVIAVITVRSFRTKHTFGRGFSAVAGLVLPLTMGFVIETPATTKKLIDLGTPVWKLMSFGRTFRQVKTEEYAKLEKVAHHDLYGTMVQLRLPNSVGLPAYRNALQLAVCWLALSAGVFGGTIVSYSMKRDLHAVELRGDSEESSSSGVRTRFSVTIVYVGLAYLAFCALKYISENTTLGWLFVIVTTVLLTASLIGAFKTDDSFKLGFAILGSLWLSSTLGFALETPVGQPLYDVRTPVWNVLSFGRGSGPSIEDYSTLRNSTVHDLFQSSGRVRLPNFREVPDIGNTMRLAACWSSLLIGLVGGVSFSLIRKMQTDNKAVNPSCR